MFNLQEQKFMLSSSFIVYAKLKENTNLTILRHFLKSFFALKLISYGTTISYIILETEQDNKNEKFRSEIEFTKDKIRYVFYFDFPDKQIYNKNLLIFISLLAHINEFYYISLETLYSYITNTLYAFSIGFHKINKTENEKICNRYNIILQDTGGANLVLSKQVIHLNNKIKKIYNNLNLSKVLCKSLIEKITSMNISNTEAVIKLLNEYGD